MATVAPEVAGVTGKACGRSSPTAKTPKTQQGSNYSPGPEVQRVIRSVSSSPGSTRQGPDDIHPGPGPTPIAWGGIAVHARLLESQQESARLDVLTESAAQGEKLSLLT
jgi:hypothetical protein